jgi:hypothetical protein
MILTHKFCWGAINQALFFAGPNPTSIQAHTESERLAKIHIKHVENRLRPENIEKSSICITFAAKRLDVKEAYILEMYESVYVNWTPVYKMEIVNGVPTKRSMYSGVALDCHFSKDKSAPG